MLSQRHKLKVFLLFFHKIILNMQYLYLSYRLYNLENIYNIRHDGNLVCILDTIILHTSHSLLNYDMMIS